MNVLMSHYDKHHSMFFFFVEISLIYFGHDLLSPAFSCPLLFWSVNHQFIIAPKVFSYSNCLIWQEILAVLEFCVHFLYLTIVLFFILFRHNKRLDNGPTGGYRLPDYTWKHISSWTTSRFSTYWWLGWPSQIYELEKGIADWLWWFPNGCSESFVF